MMPSPSFPKFRGPALVLLALLACPLTACADDAETTVTNNTTGIVQVFTKEAGAAENVLAELKPGETQKVRSVAGHKLHLRDKATRHALGTITSRAGGQAVSVSPRAKASPHAHMAKRALELTRDAATLKPQIALAVHGNILYVAYQTHGAKGMHHVQVAKLDPRELGVGGAQLTAVRSVPSGGQLVGFAVGRDGTDYVLCAKAEEFDNTPSGSFVKDIAQTRRPGTLVLYSGGKATDLGLTDKFTDGPVYGVTNFGSGRLAAGPNHLAAAFCRRLYSPPPDNLIHQQGNDLLMSKDLGTVQIKAGYTTSHSFDQRLIFDGTDFITLHACDTYPYPGLIIEKLRTADGGKAQFPVFACPTFGNDIYCALGGVVAEPDGYPVLFTATRNTAAATPDNAQALRTQPWDVGMVFVVRDFEKKSLPANPFDLLASGVLARGFGSDETFKVNGVTWNPDEKKYNKPDPRTISRRVDWLTDNKKENARAADAKLVRVGPNKYIAFWEEHTLKDGAWMYKTGWAARIDKISKPGGGVDFKRVKTERMQNCRPLVGDDPVRLTIFKQQNMAWIQPAQGKPEFLRLFSINEALEERDYLIRLPHKH